MVTQYRDDPFDIQEDEEYLTLSYRIYKLGSELEVLHSNTAVNFNKFH